MKDSTACALWPIGFRLRNMYRNQEIKICVFGCISLKRCNFDDKSSTIRFPGRTIQCGVGRDSHALSFHICLSSRIRSSLTITNQPSRKKEAAWIRSKQHLPYKFTALSKPKTFLKLLIFAQCPKWLHHLSARFPA